MTDLAIRVNPFILKSTVMVRDKELGIYREEKIAHKDLAAFISAQENLDTVHLFGNEKYVKKIEEECIAKYNMERTIFLINK